MNTPISYPKTKRIDLVERIGLPSRRGNRYFFTKNDGLQNQAVLYVADNLNAEPRVLLDPNTLSEDGTVALSGVSVTEDGSLMAYATSSGGSDWTEWFVRDVTTGENRTDHWDAVRLKQRVNFNRVEPTTPIRKRDIDDPAGGLEVG